MNKNFKYLVITLILSVVLGGISAGVFFKEMENKSVERLLSYVSSVKSNSEELDIIDTFIWFSKGYDSGDLVVGEEFVRICRLSTKNIFIKTTLVVFILSVISVIISRIKNKNFILYSTTLFLAILVVLLLPKYELDIKYLNYYDEIDSFEYNITNQETETKLETENDHILYYTTPEKIQIEQNSRGLIINRKDAKYIYIELYMPVTKSYNRNLLLNDYRNWSEIISIESITSYDGSELEFKIKERKSAPWNILIAVKATRVDNNQLNINIKNKSNLQQFNEDIIISLDDARIYEEEENEGEYGTSYIYETNYFDYYLEEKNNAFDKNMIKDIEIERIPDFEVTSISVTFIDGKSLDTDDKGITDKRGRYEVYVYLNTNFSGDANENFTNYALRSYTTEIDKLLNEYGYSLKGIEIKDLYGNIAYQNIDNPTLY